MGAANSQEVVVVVVVVYMRAAYCCHIGSRAIVNLSLCASSMNALSLLVYEYSLGGCCLYQIEAEEEERERERLSEKATQKETETTTTEKLSKQGADSKPVVKTLKLKLELITLELLIIQANNNEQQKL